jgi:ABC-2 type transport system ATP-binding protein
LPAIEVTSLRKNYRVTRRQKGLKGAVAGFFHPDTYIREAIRDINFSVKEGEMVGLIGPNGAGKSSLIKGLVGILKPDGGQVRVAGMDPFTQRQVYTRRIGVVFGQRSPLWWDLPVSDSFELLRRIYRISLDTFRTTLAYLVETFELQELLTQPVRMLSLGQKLRCTIAAAMLHNPEILFLDEPTIGLDVLVTDQMLSILGKMNAERKTTVFITSHDLNVVERLCQKMILFHEGQILFHGDFHEAIRRFVRHRRLRIATNERGRLRSLAGMIPSPCTVESMEENRLVLVFDQETLSFDDLVMFLRSVVSHEDMGIYEFYLEKPNLNDLILTVFDSHGRRKK